MHIGVIEAPKFRWGFVYCVCAGRLRFSENCCCIGLVLVRVYSFPPPFARYPHLHALKSDKSDATPKCLPFIKFVWQTSIIMMVFYFYPGLRSENLNHHCLGLIGLPYLEKTVTTSSSTSSISSSTTSSSTTFLPLPPLPPLPPFPPLPPLSPLPPFPPCCGKASNEASGEAGGARHCGGELLIYLAVIAVVERDLVASVGLVWEVQ